MQRRDLKKTPGWDTISIFIIIFLVLMIPAVAISFSVNTAIITRACTYQVSQFGTNIIAQNCQTAKTDFIESTLRGILEDLRVTIITGNIYIVKGNYSMSSIFPSSGIFSSLTIEGSGIGTSVYAITNNFDPFNLTEVTARDINMKNQFGVYVSLTVTGHPVSNISNVLLTSPCSLNVTAGTALNQRTYAHNVASFPPQQFNVSFTPQTTGNAIVIARIAGFANVSNVQLSFQIRQKLWLASDNFGCNQTFGGLAAGTDGIFVFETQNVTKYGNSISKTFSAAIRGQPSGCSSNFSICMTPGIKYNVFITISINNQSSFGFNFAGANDPTEQIGIFEQ